MKKRFAVLIVVTLALALGTARMASAESFGGDIGIMGGEPPRLSADKWQSPAAYLGLTDEQSAQLKKMQLDHYNNTRELRAKLQKAVFDLRQLGWEKNPDPGKLNSAISEVNSLRSQLYKQARDNREQMTSVLTQEQLAKIGRKAFGRGCGMGFGRRDGGCMFKDTAR
ncbi:MAG: Spy/CpxP family protein refolding chaperone [Desulfocucumaceae bacterium]